MIAADLQRIREATDIRQLIGNVVRLRKMPGNVGVGLCPFHNEKSASFRVNFAGHRFAGKFRCHGCGIAGDCFDFVMRIDSCDLPTAARRLASDAGLTISDRPETPAERRKRESDREEKALCAWWMRTQWKEARRGLNRAMSAMDRGNPFAEDLANIYGCRLVWIAANRGTAAGLARFRREDRSGVERRYRIWLCGDLARYAAAAELTGLVIRTWEYCDSLPGNGSNHTSVPLSS